MGTNMISAHLRNPCFVGFLIFGDYEAQYSLNVRAHRLSAATGGEGIWMGKMSGHSVVEQSQTHNNLAL